MSGRIGRNKEGGKQGEEVLKEGWDVEEWSE